MSNEPNVPESEEAGELVSIGQVCGVCRWPTAPGVICGNPVYATSARGTLPKFCGAPGQDRWQREWRTPGDSGHLAERAGYARKVTGMSAKEAKELAEARTRELGIHHRAPRHPVAEIAPAPVVSVADHTAETAAPATEPAVTPAAEAEYVQLDRLAEMLNGAGELIAGLRTQLDALRAECDRRIDQESTRARAAVEAEAETRQTIAGIRADAASAVEQAQTDAESSRAEAVTAREERLRVEGRLESAQQRIAELESELARERGGHQEDIARVRREATESAERMMRTALSQAGSEQQQQRVPEWWEQEGGRPPESAVRELLGRIQGGHVSRHGDQWHSSENVLATRTSARALDWLLAHRVIALMGTDPARAVVVQQQGR